MLFIDCFKGIKWSGSEREGPLLGCFDDGGDIPVGIVLGPELLKIHYFEAACAKL